jgi:hypothetical protein
LIALNEANIKNFFHLIKNGLNTCSRGHDIHFNSAIEINHFMEKWVRKIVGIGFLNGTYNIAITHNNKSVM